MLPDVDCEVDIGQTCMYKIDMNTIPKLLTRDEFREAVFSRDRHLCVVCGGKAQDAHHIMERRLWADGGYYLENGVSLCSLHHLAAEHTHISPEHCRNFANIKEVILPPGFDPNLIYDKWGNEYLGRTYWKAGPLFWTDPVQKIVFELDMFDRFSD